MGIFNRRFITDFDWVLFGLALVICAIGVVQISSVEPLPGMWHKQLMTILLAGLPILFVTTLLDYHKIVNAAPIFYIIGVVLLIAVLLFGKVVNGNKNWLEIGPVRGQPSEIVKIFTILMLTRFLADVRKRPLDLRAIAMTCGIWLVPAVLVFLENDTGSTLSYMSFLAAMLLIGGISWRWVAAGAAGLVLVVALAGFWLSHLDTVKYKDNYKIQRILAVYFPDKAEKRYTYQNEQAEIAVGSGGVTGKGFGHGSQGSLGFLPEVETDFIFCSTGRRDRVHWNDGFTGAVCDHYHATDRYCALGARPDRVTARHRLCGTVVVPCRSQYGNGAAAVANYWHPAAADEFWRIVAAGDVFRPRPGAQCASAPVCQLTR